MLRRTAPPLLLAGLLPACAAGGRSPSRAPRLVPSTGFTSVAPAPARGARSVALDPPAKDYLVYTVSESADQVALVRFGPKGIAVERSHKVGMMPTEINGPHGIAVSPDKKHYYVSIAHGTPYGTLWKYSTEGDSLLGRVTLGLFPATAQVTPDGSLIFVVNFNLHGDMVPSSVSIVSTDEMVEIARPVTCTMPHGSRINPQGTKQYSACMMDDMLVEIDTRELGVSRHFMLGAGKERGMAGPPAQHAPAATAEHASMGHDGASAPASVSCSPTWAQPSADGSHIFVACNKSNDIVDIDATTWAMVRRIPAGNGVYNLAVSPDGKLLLGTNKRAQSVSVYDIATGRELAKIATKRKVVHGVVVSPDSRYAFVTVEGIGSEPGTLEVIDLKAMASIASVDLGQQAAGIDFFREEPAR